MDKELAKIKWERLIELKKQGPPLENLFEYFDLYYQLEEFFIKAESKVDGPSPS